MKNRDIEVARNTLVDLSSCTREALESLPDGLRVAGGLNLRWCTTLETLPSGLVVGGSLSLYGCEKLKALPSGLVVGGELYLYGCEKLMDLPRDLQVTGAIHYDKDTGFTRNRKKLRELEVRFPGKLKRW